MMVLTDLARTTFTAPRAAARDVLAFDLNREALWTALALVAAVNTVLLQLLFSVLPAETQAALPAYVQSPLTLFVVLAGLIVVYVHSAYWAGLAIGGQGRLEDVLALLVWLQTLCTLVQMAVVVLVFAIPSATSVLLLLAFSWSLWVLLTFLTEALALPSLGHALFALLIAIVTLALGLATMLALIGLVAQGTVTHV